MMPQSESEDLGGRMTSSGGPETFKRPLPLYTIKSNPVHQALFFSAYYRTNETWRAYPQMNAELTSPSSAPLMYITKLVSSVGGVQVIAEDQSDVSQLSVADASDEFEDVELARDLDDMSYLVHDMESEATGRPCLCGCARMENTSKYDDCSAVEQERKSATEMQNGSVARNMEYMGSAALRESNDFSEEATLMVRTEPTDRATSDRSELLEIADLCGDLLADLLQECHREAENATDDISTFSMEEFYIWDR
ncbi:hypothetical protein AAVH_05190 [Aphelenchoides avenae]|nr:hypothetical protein AAVH_05190 [Aphelenchus avenae]